MGARMLKREHEHDEEERMGRLMQELQFSEPEVEQFRIIFRQAVKREQEKAAEISTDGKKEPAQGLTRESVRRLVRSLGVSLSPETTGILLNKLADLDNNGVLDFLGFLRLMKWLVDTNFAGVNDAATKA